MTLSDLILEMVCGNTDGWIETIDQLVADIWPHISECTDDLESGENLTIRRFIENGALDESYWFIKQFGF